MWDQGKIIRLGTFDAIGGGPRRHMVNNDGVVVGTILDRVAVWYDGTAYAMTSLAPNRGRGIRLSSDAGGLVQDFESDRGLLQRSRRFSIR